MLSFEKVNTFKQIGKVIINWVFLSFCQWSDSRKYSVITINLIYGICIYYINTPYWKWSVNTSKLIYVYRYTWKNFIIGYGEKSFLMNLQISHHLKNIENYVYHWNVLPKVNIHIKYKTFRGKYFITSKSIKYKYVDLISVTSRYHKNPTHLMSLMFSHFRLVFVQENWLV